MNKRKRANKNLEKQREKWFKKNIFSFEYGAGNAHLDWRITAKGSQLTQTDTPYTEYHEQLFVYLRSLPRYKAFFWLLRYSSGFNGYNACSKESFRYYEKIDFIK